MSHFNVNNNRQTNTNSNDYFLVKKYISIHSEDRDTNKYPNSSEFEIELPQDYLNINSMRLTEWSFPCIYDVFSQINNNISFYFKIHQPYNPAGYYNLYNQDVDTEGNPVFDSSGNPVYTTRTNAENIYSALNYYTTLPDFIFNINIQNGYYNPNQMVTELTNRCNQIVTENIITYFKANGIVYDSSTFYYTRFTVVFNEVNQKISFGNSCDNFMLNNGSSLYDKKLASCQTSKYISKITNWGLPYHLGFNQKDIYATLSTDYTSVPRFYYGDVSQQGDSGLWLVPSEPSNTVYYIDAVSKINLMGTSYIYLELSGCNNIDETSPYNLNKYATQLSEANGSVNSSFAKLPVLSVPISRWYDQINQNYKFFNPPAERIRKLKFKLRYHDGQLADFGNMDYSFVIELNMLTPQVQRSYNIRDPYDLAQIQSK